MCVCLGSLISAATSETKALLLMPDEDVSISHLGLIKDNFQQNENEKRNSCALVSCLDANLLLAVATYLELKHGMWCLI